MNQPIRTTTLRRLGTAIVLLGLITAVPVLRADDGPKIKIKENKVKIKGEGARELLKPEVNETFGSGYTIPNQYHPHFTEVPAREGENVVVRYYGRRAYYVNSTDWKIVRVDLDAPVEVTTDDAVYIEGYVIPDTNRTRFVEVRVPMRD